MQLGSRELHGYGRVEVGDDTTKRVLNCRRERERERERDPLTETHRDRQRQTDRDRQRETKEGGRKRETEQAM